jgi:hypothetical protein
VSLLTIVQRTCGLLGLNQPTVVVSSPDKQIQQLYQIANEEGADLASSFDWQRLTRQWTFTTVDDPVQPLAVPEDWNRYLHNSQFNRTTLRPVYGPITPQRWQAIQVYPQFSGVFIGWRLRDGDYLVTPNPPDGQTVAYEYVSSYWAKSDTGDAKEYFTADSDTTYLIERLFILGIRWRWKSAKGLVYAEDMKTYEMEKERAQSRDGGSTSIQTGGADYYDWRANLPDGNFPGPS